MEGFRHTFTVDFSYDYTTDVAGVGIVIQGTANRKRRGPVMDTVAEAYAGIPPGVGESLAIFRALEIAKGMGCERVRIRSDYNQLRKALESAMRGGVGAGAGPLKSAILDLAQRFEYAEFRWVPRRRNQMAHRLANEGRRKTPQLRDDIVEMLG